jgi:hypothetical protein
MLRSIILRMPEAKSGTIDVAVTHAPLAFIYRLFTPAIEINGNSERKRWGEHSFSLPPGTYAVSVSYPCLFAPVRLDAPVHDRMYEDGACIGLNVSKEMGRIGR